MVNDVENQLCLSSYIDLRLLCGYWFLSPRYGGQPGERRPWALKVGSQLLEGGWQHQVLIRVEKCMEKTNHCFCLTCHLGEFVISVLKLSFSTVRLNCIKQRIIILKKPLFLPKDRNSNQI